MSPLVNESNTLLTASSLGHFFQARTIVSVKGTNNVAQNKWNIQYLSSAVNSAHLR